MGVLFFPALVLPQNRGTQIASTSAVVDSREVSRLRRPPQVVSVQRSQRAFFGNQLDAGFHAECDVSRFCTSRKFKPFVTCHSSELDVPPQSERTESPPLPDRSNTQELNLARSMFKLGHSTSKLKVFSGSGNEDLAAQIANYLGVELGNVVRKQFSDGETYIRLLESVRGCDVFIVQPTCTEVNRMLMELFIMIDACRRASAHSVTAVMPYYGYARADKLHSGTQPGRESITAKLAAILLSSAGANHVIAMDLHTTQIQGFFDIPVDHVYASPVLLSYLTSKGLGDNLVVVSPDVGGVARARAYAKKLGVPLAIVDKRRQEHNKCEVMNLIGDVEGKTCVIVDDMIDTAGTICNGGEFLRKKGAKAVYACATHAVFSGPARERLSSGVFEEVIVTNTIPVKPDESFPQLKVLSVADLLGETILRVHENSSVMSMFCN